MNAKITPIRKATAVELAAIGPPPLQVKWTVGISHLEVNERAFFPTHSVDVIIKQRESVYQELLSNYNKDRAIKILKTSEKDLILFRQHWLNFELQEIDRLNKILGITSDLTELEKYHDYINIELQNVKPKKEGELRKLALIAAHKVEPIGPEKSKLRQYYNFYLKRHNRISPEASKLKTTNKILLFESIIPDLSKELQSVVNDEIDILRKSLKENF